MPVCSSSPIPVTPRRRARSDFKVVVPADFPHPRRLAGTPLFKAVHGGVPRSTWAKWKATGKIPKPDKQVGSLSFWWEENIWKTLNGDAEKATAA
jgi:hypothetical protein